MTPIDTEALRGVTASILSDIMDSLGLGRRAMAPFVRPLDDALVLVGRARTGLYMPAYSVREGENPYEVEIALVDDLKPGEVIVLACNGPPVFHGGIGPLDTKGRARMVERDGRVECGGVAIDSGDLVFGDVDGVVVVPRHAEDRVMALALAKVTGENHTRDALLAGESLASVFSRLGIL